MSAASSPPADQAEGSTVPASGGITAAAATRLAQPGLVIVTGPVGSGRSHVLRRIAAAFRGQVFTGGGLSMLRANPGLALARAVRAKLPTHDVPLCAEAVRSRVRGGLLVLDDLQWCDPVTLAVLPRVAEHCRVVAALRSPHRLPEEIMAQLGDVGVMLDVMPLPDESATALVRHHAPSLADVTVSAIVGRAGGNPLVLASLARRAQRRPEATGQSAAASADTVHSLAEAIADLSRAGRTAMAALGLLGRPATSTLLGDGVAELVEAGMVTVDGQALVTAVSPYCAEVAAGLLDSDARAQLHRAVAARIDDLEAARHLSAAGDHDQAYERALRAADDSNKARHTEALLFACGLPSSPADEGIRLRAARAALTVGRPRAALTVLQGLESVEARVTVAQARLHAGHVVEAAEVAAGLPSGEVLAAEAAAQVDRVRLLAALAHGDASEVAAEVKARHGGPQVAHAGVAAALAAFEARHRRPGWQSGLAAAAAAAGRAGDALTARWSAWLLVEYLMNDGNLAQAAATAESAAAACAVDHAYSWQTRFLAAQLWCQVLGGQELEDATAKAVTLLDHALPSVARGYAAAAASLAEADAGGLRNARQRLRHAGPVPPSVAVVLRWVAGESAWLDNQPSQAAAGVDGAPSLVTGLGLITSAWAAFDAGQDAEVDDAALFPSPARRTLRAWRDAGRDAAKAVEFDAAADEWREVVRREQVRCLLAYGMYAADSAVAIPPLEAAESIADEAGMTVLAGRARQALRRHHVRRDRRGKRAGDALTSREQQVLTMVAAGEPTRRIAGTLGITRETVETHIRAGMRKLGAKTRTEAAVRAVEVAAQEG